MTGKAKPKKHTAKEIAAKIDAATTNRGGGKAGVADRLGLEKGGKASPLLGSLLHYAGTVRFPRNLLPVSSSILSTDR